MERAAHRWGIPLTAQEQVEIFGTTAFGAAEPSGLAQFVHDIVIDSIME
ncbi:hypothetical protein [Arthrobacter sp. SLBN-53]|nr:hypothetical protein [Arthrobacter sp. SLBN-53]TQK29496.1 hypothetical protein FBY28_2504 [Arthrobacter sp. SLBN-53]